MMSEQFTLVRCPIMNVLLRSSLCEYLRVFSSFQFRNSIRNMTEAKRLKFFNEQTSQNNIIWIDCEMTGLDLNKDCIVEISCIITDGDLNIIDECPGIVIHQSDIVLDAMNDLVKNMHSVSGLTEEIKKSKVTTEEAEETVLSFIQKHTPYKKCPLAGNSVHHDKEFLRKEMPRLIDHFHHRIIDVSTISELFKRWYPLSRTIKKNGNHRALVDIRESIRELKFYRQTIFK